jgi:acetyltransferase-like isoleucine patch superfamily enzyme
MQIKSMVNGSINLIDRLGWSLSSFLWSLLLRINFNLKGVKLGRSSKFFGYTKLKRTNGSLIVIGKNLILRSAPTSNLIGVNRPCIITALEREAILTIGDNCGFSGVIIGCFKEITIGNNVMVGANSTITDGDWHLNDPRASAPKPIIIGDNVWLGINVTVLKGVTIGDNSFIGAGSVVTRDIPSNVIAAGNPCMILRNI